MPFVQSEDDFSVLIDREDGSQPMRIAKTPQNAEQIAQIPRVTAPAISVAAPEVPAPAAPKDPSLLDRVGGFLSGMGLSGGVAGGGVGALPVTGQGDQAAVPTPQFAQAPAPVVPQVPATPQAPEAQQQPTYPMVGGGTAGTSQRDVTTSYDGLGVDGKKLVAGLSGINKAQQEAVKAEANALTLQNQATADQIEQNEYAREARAQQKQAVADKIAGELKQSMDRSEGIRQELKDHKFENFFDNHSRVYAGIAIALGAVGAALTKGENVAAKMIDSAIQRDMEMQKQKYQQKKDSLEGENTIYGQIIKKGATEQEAAEIAYQSGIDKAKAKLQETAARSNNAVVQAKAQAAIAELDMTAQQSLIKFADTKKTQISNRELNQTTQARPATAEEIDKSLPKDKQDTISVLAKKNGEKIAIKNQIDSFVTQYKNAKSDTDKIRIGRSMLKIMNSTEGADAIGVEEAKRLGDALEFNLLNLTGPGAVVGRDLKGFEAQVGSVSKAIQGGIDRNQAQINQLRGVGGGQTIKPIEKAGGKRVGAIKR